MTRQRRAEVGYSGRRMPTLSAALLPPVLAKVNFSDPVFLAVLIGWILSVVLHELAHGIVAYLGGDYTIRERGGLTLNPFQYIHPLNSIILPALFLLMGGVPLPGGVTYVRRDLLRSRAWDTAVSLAGPATNFLLFVLLLLPMHPKVDWVHPPADPTNWTSAQQFLATLATLQFFAAIFNLIPVPPLDGFGAVRPYLSRDLQEKTDTPAAANFGLIFVFLVVSNIPGFFQTLYDWRNHVLAIAGMESLIEGIRRAFNSVMFGV